MVKYDRKCGGRRLFLTAVPGAENGGKRGDWMIRDFLEIGKVVGTHGVKGELRVQPWCDTPGFMKQFSVLYWDAAGNSPVRVQSCRPHGNVVLLKAEGVDTMEHAQSLRGRILYMRRADARLPEGGYFIQELIGCRVLDADTGVLYGEMTDVSETGANDVWHITKDGTEYLLPAIRQVVISVDVAQGEILIRPMRGIFDEAVYAD